MTKKKVVRSVKGVKKRPNYKGRVREFRLGRGLPDPQEIREELKGYRDVLFGRKEPPLDKGVMTLMEVAEGYFSRVCEIEQNILEAQANGVLPSEAKKNPYHTLRTQELRSYKEMFKSATELGSRRITFENLRTQQEMRGLESL